MNPILKLFILAGSMQFASVAKSNDQSKILNLQSEISLNLISFSIKQRIIGGLDSRRLVQRL